MHDVQKRKRGNGKERERSRSLFFASSSNGNALFRVSDFFSLSLLLFYYYVLALSLVHSRGFSERDNWVRWKRSFHSNFFFLHIHTHRHLARNGWYTLCIVWFALIYKHQVISASVGGEITTTIYLF
jgi:hypothetical protein